MRRNKKLKEEESDPLEVTVANDFWQKIASQSGQRISDLINHLYSTNWLYHVNCLFAVKGKWPMPLSL